MRRSWTFSLVAAGVAALTVHLIAQRGPAGIRIVASVLELHEALINPASDAVFEASGTPPADDAGWLAARHQALVLAESGNLLMIGSRVRDNDNWMRLSRAMVDGAARAADAAAKKDATALEAATDAITVACEACHRPYRDGGRQMGVPR